METSVWFFWDLMTAGTGQDSNPSQQRTRSSCRPRPWNSMLNTQTCASIPGAAGICLAHMALCIWCEWVLPWAMLNMKAFRESYRSCTIWKHQLTVEWYFCTLIAVPTMLTATPTHDTATTSNNLTASPSHYSGLKSLWNQELNKPLNCFCWVLGHHDTKVSNTW